MTLNELIERLEEYRDQLGEDCEVRLMTQQNWPFENGVYGRYSCTFTNEGTPLTGSPIAIPSVAGPDTPCSVTELDSPVALHFPFRRVLASSIR